MENGEDDASVSYEAVSHEVPEARRIGEDEQRHEQALIQMLDEERLQYVGSMVLGLNDALVELTGADGGRALESRPPPQHIPAVKVEVMGAGLRRHVDPPGAALGDEIRHLRGADVGHIDPRPAAGGTAGYRLPAGTH